MPPAGPPCRGTRSRPRAAREDVLVHLERREDDHLDAGELRVRGDLLGRGHARPAGHPDVHEHHVGRVRRAARPPRRRRRPRRRPPCRGAAPTRTPNPARISSWSSTTSTRIVIVVPRVLARCGTDRSTGRTARTRYRCPSAPTSRAPPTAWTRSRIPTKTVAPALFDRVGSRRRSTPRCQVVGACGRGQLRVSDPCLWAFVSASWITRYAVRSTTGASGRGSPWPEVDDEPGGVHVVEQPVEHGQPGRGRRRVVARLAEHLHERPRARSARSRSRPARARARRARPPVASRAASPPPRPAPRSPRRGDRARRAARARCAGAPRRPGGRPPPRACVRPARRGPARPRAWSVASRRRTRRRARPPGAPRRA